MDVQMFDTPPPLKQGLALSIKENTNSCVMVVKVFDHQQASHKGVQKGDILLKISADKKVWRMGDLDMLKRHARKAQPFEIFVLRRNNQTQPSNDPSSPSGPKVANLKRKASECSTGIPPDKEFTVDSSSAHDNEGTAGEDAIFIPPVECDASILAPPGSPDGHERSVATTSVAFSRTPELIEKGRAVAKGRSVFATRTPRGRPDATEITTADAQGRGHFHVQIPPFSDRKLMDILLDPYLEEILRYHPLEVLDKPEHLAEFVENNGVETIFATMERTQSNEVHTFCWEILDNALRFLDCEEKLKNIAIYPHMVSSLRICKTDKLFHVLLCIMLSPAMSIQTSLHDFFATEAAIPSFLNAMSSYARHDQDTLVECFRLVNQILILHPEGLRIVRAQDGLSKIAFLMDRCKHSPAVQLAGKDTLCNLLV